MPNWNVKEAGKELWIALAATAGTVMGFLGIKSWHDKQEEHKMRYAAEQERYAATLKEQNLEKRREISKMCENIGQYNNVSGNFRQMVRQNGQEGPNTRQPDPDTGQPVEIVPSASLPI